MASRHRTKKYKRKATQSKALSVANKALRVARGEMYYLDTSNATEAISYAGDITLVSGIAQGDDANNRSGNSCMPRSLELRAEMTGNGSSIGNGVTMRCLIVQDKENTGTTPTVADILQTTGSTLVTTSPYNVDHLARYHILFDRCYSLNCHNSLTATTFVPERKELYKRVKLNNKLYFTGSASSDVYKNALYVVWACDVNTNDPVVQWYTRLAYND